MFTAISIAFTLLGALCVALGLPGTWLMLAAAVLLELFDGALPGTFGGALAGELSHPGRKELDDKAEYKDALKPALAATVGRVLGTVGKAGIAAAVWLALTAALFFG